MSHDTDFSPDRAIDNRQTASAGLSSSEARARLEQYGFNAVSWQSSGDAGWSDGYVAWYRKFVWGALLVAAGASVVLMHLADGVLLFALLAVGGLFAFDERRKTAARIADIEEETALRAQVLRDGKRQHVEIDLLVPGDVVYLEKNDRAFADMRLIEAENFWVLKTPIEGAGVPLQRIADAEIRVGEVVVQGNARAIVVRTGERTLAGGAAAGSFPRESEATPLQRTLWRIRRSHGILALSAFWAVVAAGIIQFRDISEIVLIGVCLLVAALPESVFSLALSVLAREMRNARSLGIVFYRPLAIEKLAMANVVCTQKTGILTKGEMSLVAMTSAGEASPDGDWEREILKAALICCDTDLQDPVDAAIVSAARERGIRVEDEQNGRNGQKALFVDEVPFDSSRHLKTVLIRTDSGYRVYSRVSQE